METSNKVITDFFGGLPEHASQNTVRMLYLISGVSAHKERIESILSLVGYPNVTVDEFRTMLVYQNIELQKMIDEGKSNILISKPLSGKHLNVVKDYPLLWSMHALYWGYRVDKKTEEDILFPYNPRIGDIALKFIEFYHKMKQKEKLTGENNHLFSFYEFIAAGKVRAIEFLIGVSQESSLYLKNLYLDIDDGMDMDLNFFTIQNTNRWESDSLYVVKASGRNVMKYENEEEGLSFQIFSSRMLKDGSVKNFEDAQHKTLQLYRLDGANTNSKYSSKIRSTGQAKFVGSQPIVEELEEALIPLVRSLPRNISYEEKAELKVMNRQQFRDNTLPEIPVHPDLYDSNYAQQKRNRAMSSNITKNGLLLPSEYDIPISRHLKEFSQALPVSDDDSSKLMSALFVLHVSMGCSFEELVKMIKGDKSYLSFKDNVMTSKIDSSIFAESIGTLSEVSGNTISYQVPRLMGMLLSWVSRTIDNECSLEQLLDSYEEFFKAETKKFHHEIELDYNRVYRILKSYAKEHQNDLLSSCFSTGSYSPAEAAKLSYASPRSNSANHSQLVSKLWIELGFDSVSRKVLGLPEDLFTTATIEVSQVAYAGASSCVMAPVSKCFFEKIALFIEEFGIESDEAFNLSSIGVRYAMSLLLGTRGFSGSSRFESASFSERMLMVSEKATSIPAGIRVIPMCQTITSILQAYDKDFLQPRGLQRNVWLVKDGKYESYKQKTAYSFVETTPILQNSEVLKQYVYDVPLNTGRHCFTKKALELDVPSQFIGAYLGHYFAGAEQFGIYSTMNVVDYRRAVENVNTSIANAHGIKDRLW